MLAFYLSVVGPMMAMSSTPRLQQGPDGLQFRTWLIYRLYHRFLRRTASRITFPLRDSGFEGTQTAFKGWLKHSFLTATLHCSSTVGRTRIMRNTYINIYIHTYTYATAYAYAYTYMYTYTHEYSCTYTCKYTYTPTHACMHTYIYIYMYTPYTSVLCTMLVHMGSCR